MITRKSSGRSAVAAAAYRAGEKLHDEESGKDWKYKKEEAIYSKITLPQNAPAEFADRETLWNSVQKVEKNADSRLARELVIAFPNELSQEQARRITEDFSQFLANKGMCVDAAIHWKNGNHHAHLMLTTRKIDKNGRWAEWKERKEYARDEKGNKIPLLDKNGKQKIRERKGKGVEKLWKRVSVLADEWSKKTEYNSWKKELAGMMNAELEKIGVSDKVDYRSYQEQGKDILPQVHEGYAARAIEKRGGKSFLCEHNRKIRAINAKIEQTLELEKRIAELKMQKEEQQKPEQNAQHEKITICTIDGLSPQQRQAVARAVNPILNGIKKGYIARFPTFKAQFWFREDFVKNAVFAKTSDGGVHLLNINRGNAIKNGLLGSGGKSKDFTKAQIKDMSKNIKAVANAMFSLLDDKTTSQQHLQKAKDNVLDIFKTPPQAVFDIIKNPVTGILSLPAKIFSMLSSAAEAGLNLMGAVAKGGSMGTGGGRPSNLGFGKLPVDWNTLSDEEKERIIAKMEQEELERMCGAYERDTTRVIAPPPVEDEKKKGGR